MRGLWWLVLLTSCDGGTAAIDAPADMRIDAPTDARIDARIDAPVDAPLPVPPYDLRVTPSGGGRITSAAASMIDCGDTCIATYAVPTMVTLNAVPDSASRFVGWSGDCTGTGPCTVLVDRARAVAATFSTCASLGVPSALIASSGPDAVSALAIDVSGAVIAAGTLHDDIVVSKHSATGSGVWTRTFGGSGVDAAHAVVVLANGDVVVAGHYEESVAFDGTTLTSHGFEDMFVVRLDATSGSVVWVVSFGGRYRDLALGLALTSTGDLVLAGQFADPVAFGPTVLVATYLDGVVARLSAVDGMVRWARSLGSIEVDLLSFDHAASVAVTPSDLVVITGTTRSRADLGTGTVSRFDGTLDVLVAAYQADLGAPVWSHLYGSQGDDHGRTIAVGIDGGIYVAGDFGDATADFGGTPIVDPPGPNPWGGGFLAKYDQAGAYQWSRAFSSSGLDSVASVAALPAASGGVAVGGTFGRTGNLGTGNLNPAAESEDAFTAVVAANGTVVWTRRFGERGDDAGEAVAVDGTGPIWLAGSFRDAIDLCHADGQRTASAGNRDGFVVRVDPPAAPVSEPTIAPAPAATSPVIPAGGACPSPPPIPSSTPAVGPMPTFDVISVPLPPGQNWMDGIPIAADIDGDGDDDFVVAAFDSRPGSWGQVRVLRNTNGVFSEDTASVFGGDRVDVDFPRDVTAFDANGDGKTDIWFAEHGWDGPPFLGTNYGLLLSTPTGLIDARYSHVPNERLFSHDVGHGDVDCDGDQDVIVTGERLLVNDGTGHFTAEQNFRYPPDPDHRVDSALWTELCDVDRDGDPDLLAGSGGHHMLYDVLLINDGAGRFTRAPEGTLPIMSVPFGSAHNIVCADFDRDGWNDFYIERAAGSGTADEIWLNRGDGTFADASTGAGFQVNVPQHGDVRAADLNGDGWVDLVGASWLGSCNGESPVYINQGNGTFAQLPIGVSGECRMVIPIQAGPDMHVDLWAMSWGANTASLYLNTTP